MLIALNRFLTTEEVRHEYRVPEALAEEILSDLPVVETLEDGSRIHLEQDVDDYLSEFSRQRRKAVAMLEPLPHGKPGRNNETSEIALYADELRRSGKSWKEIFRECRDRWPDDGRVKNPDQIRATHIRHFPKRRKTN